MSGIQVNVRRLKELRKLHGLSQQELALRAGVSVRTVGNAERGRRIRPEFAGYLAATLGVELADLAADREELRLARWHQRRIERVLTTIEAIAVSCDVMEYKNLLSGNAVMYSAGPDLLPFAGERRGMDGLRQLNDVWTDLMAFEGVQEINEIHSVGNEVLIVGKSGIRSRKTNKSVVAPFHHRYVFDEDRVVRLESNFNVPLVVQAFTPG